MSGDNDVGEHYPLKGITIDDNESSYGSIGSSDSCCHDYPHDDLESCLDVPHSHEFIISVKVEGAPPTPCFSTYVKSPDCVKPLPDPYVSIVAVDDPGEVKQPCDSDNESDGYGSFLSTSDDSHPEGTLVPVSPPTSPTSSVKNIKSPEVEEQEEDEVTKECREYFEKRLKCTQMRWMEVTKDSKGEEIPGTNQQAEKLHTNSIDSKLSHLRGEIVSLMSLDNDLFHQLLTLHDSVRELKQDHWKDYWEEDSEIDSSHSLSDSEEELDGEDNDHDVGLETDFSQSPSSTLSDDAKPRGILKNRGHLVNTSFIRQRVSYPPTSRSRERRICHKSDQPQLSKSNSFSGSPHGVRKLRSQSFSSSTFTSPECVIPEAASLSSLPSGFSSWVRGTRILHEEIYV